MVSVMKCIDLRFKAGICTKEVKINLAKPTVIDCAKKNTMRVTCTLIDYSTRGVNNHAGSTLMCPTGTKFSHAKCSIKLPQGEGCLTYPRTCK